MSPRAQPAGTEAVDPAVLPALLPRTTVASSGPAACSGAHHLPFIRCGECGHTEPAAGIGSRSGEVVRLAGRHFADERGYYYCPRCFVVWNTLPIHRSLNDPAEAVAPPAQPYARLGAGIAWSAAEAPGAKWRRLAGVQRNVHTSFDFVGQQARASRGSWPNSTLQRAGDRLRDVEAACSALRLPHVICEAASYHVAQVSTRTRYRNLANKTREEAFTLATIALVAERFGYTLDERALLETTRFADGSTVAPAEYAKAREALRAWYAENVWRDSHPSKEDNDHE